jgi:AcrR family transcriptional regulator
MRQLDENKKRAIGNAAIHLIITVGFAETSMSKIAKQAKVSPATIYTYFDNNEDMLNKLFLMVKRNFGDELLNGFDSNMPIKEGLRVVFNNIYNFFVANPT